MTNAAVRTLIMNLRVVPRHLRTLVNTFFLKGLNRRQTSYRRRNRVTRRMKTRTQELSVTMRIRQLRRSTHGTRLLIRALSRHDLISALTLTTGRMTMRISINMVRNLTTQRKRMNMSIVRMRNIQQRERIKLTRRIHTVTRTIRGRVLIRARIPSLVPNRCLFTQRNGLMTGDNVHTLMSLLMRMIKSGRISTLITLLGTARSQRRNQGNHTIRPIVQVSSLMMHALYLTRTQGGNSAITTILLIRHTSSAKVANLPLINLNNHLILKTVIRRSGLSVNNMVTPLRGKNSTVIRILNNIVQEGARYCSFVRNEQWSRPGSQKQG